MIFHIDLIAILFVQNLVNLFISESQGQLNAFRHGQVQTDIMGKRSDLGDFERVMDGLVPVF